MADRIFAYIDGESHFIRSEDMWRKIHGPDACLDRFRHVGQTDDRMVLFKEKAKVFWTRRMIPGVMRATYFTSAVGNESKLHEIKLALRNFNLEPYVVPERKPLAERRQNILRDKQLIEKPKQVDIALAVRMLEDANLQVFDVCHLYTSDVDFLPVIEAVRSRGKQVYVHGFKNGLAKESPLLHVPDLFVDLEETFRTECELAPSK